MGDKTVATAQKVKSYLGTNPEFARIRPSNYIF